MSQRARERGNGLARAGGRPACGRVLRLLSASLTIGALLPAAAAAGAPGSQDGSFAAGGTYLGPAGTAFAGAATQADGKVVLVGQSSASGAATLLLERLTVSGAPDPTFGSGGTALGPVVPGAPGGNSVGRAVAIQGDGRIVVVGKDTNFDATGRDGVLVERFNANGSLDTGFGQGGVVVLFNGGSRGDGYSLALDPTGKILVGGSADADGSSNGVYPRAALARLNPNGSLDGSFASGGTGVFDFGAYSYAYALALQPDGKVVLAGSQSPGLQSVNAVIARLTATGGVDPSFAAGAGAIAKQYAVGGAASSFNALTIQPDGKIAAAGAASSGGNGKSGADAFVARFSPAGTPDGGFGSGGVAYAPAAINYLAGNAATPGAYGLMRTPNGDLVAAGKASSGAQTYGALWAFNATGALDPAFGSGGAVIVANPSGQNESESALALAPDGSLLTAGTQSSGGASFGIVTRLAGFPAPIPPKPKPKPKPKPAPFRISVRVPARLTWRKVRSGGLAITVTATAAGRISASATIPVAAARALHLKVRRNQPILFARGSFTLRRAGRGTITLHSSAGLFNLLKHRRVSLMVVVVGTPARSGRRVTSSASVRLTP